MKSVIELLEKHYLSFIDQERYWNFFLGLSDYVVLVRETPETKEIIERVMDTKIEDLQKIQKLHVKTVKEFKQSKEKILRIIKDNKISSVELDKAIKELEMYENGSLLTSRSKPQMYEHCLFEIALNLSDDRRKDLLKDFIDNSGRIRNIYGNFVFSKTFFELNKEVEKLEEKRKVTLWHAWDRLSLVYSVLHEKEKITAELRNDKSQFWAVAEYNWFEMISEMNRIEESAKSIFDEQRKFYFFKKDEYKLCAARIHNFLLKELNNANNTKIKTTRTETFFNSDTVILSVKGIEINFNDKPNQKCLLATLFKNPKKIWGYDEVYEDWGENDFIKNGWRKLYTAGEGINKLVAIEIGIKDFIIKDTKQIQINSNYV